MASRGKYWSNSRFATWLQRKATGTTPPTSATLEEWAEWNQKFGKTSPITYWITEVLFDRVQDIIFWPADTWWNILYYINNRFVSKSHYMRTGLKPGEWHELDTRLLHGMFTELVDFIEIEKAWMQVCFSGEQRKKYNVPFWRSGRLIRFRRWRCPEAGLHHLEWEMNLREEFEGLYEGDRELQPDYMKPTAQAEAASIQYELYHWWKNVRPNRPDAGVASGWDQYCEDRENRRQSKALHQPLYTRSVILDILDEQDRKLSSSLLEKMRDIEQQYDEEDERMLIKLIQIRGSLWT